MNKKTHHEMIHIVNYLCLKVQNNTYIVIANYVVKMDFTNTKFSIMLTYGSPRADL